MVVRDRNRTPVLVTGVTSLRTELIEDHPPAFRSALDCWSLALNPDSHPLVAQPPEPEDKPERIEPPGLGEGAVAEQLAGGPSIARKRAAAYLAKYFGG
jgi:hypothetical protein